jgi:hypothetical protein
MEWLTGKLTDAYNTVRDTAAGVTQKAVDTVPKPAVATSKASEVLGAQPERGGKTTTGGRRPRRTRSRSGGRKTRKMLRRR